MHRPVVTIAGSDPSGGAGLQADLKTFHQHGLYGMSVVTLLTAQNTQGVQGILDIPTEFVQQQLRAIATDITPAAIKTGALGRPELIASVAESLGEFDCPVVVDPVMVSKHGHPLMTSEAVDVLREKLIPAALLVTPNRHEAQQLTGLEICDIASMQAAAQRIRDLGAKNVLLKSGTIDGRATDLLLAGTEFIFLSETAISSTSTHGSGCVLSAAITAWLGLGCNLETAVRRAKSFVTRAIETAPQLGYGHGPLNIGTEPISGKSEAG